MKKFLAIGFFIFLLAGCAGDQLLVNLPISFQSSYPYNEYGVYRLPQIAIFNNTKYALRVFINGDAKALLASGQRLKLVIQVWPRENRQMSLVAQAFDGERYVGVTRPMALYPYMSVNYNRAEALVIEEHDIRPVGR